MLFEPEKGHIFVPVRCVESGVVHEFTLVLDTGSTHTLVDRTALEYLGFSADENSPLRRIITGSDIVSAPTIVLPNLEIEGIRKEDFPVVAFNFPKEAGINGVLGLDFFRGTKLTLDFKEGILEID